MVTYYLPEYNWASLNSEKSKEKRSYGSHISISRKYPTERALVRDIIRQWIPLETPDSWLSIMHRFLHTIYDSIAQPKALKEERLGTLCRRITTCLVMGSLLGQTEPRSSTPPSSVQPGSARGKHGSKFISYTTLGFHKPPLF